MTNFTNEIRRDLLAHPPSTREGAAAALAALIATGASLSGDGFEIVSENERVAEYFVRLTELFGARPEVREATRDPKRKRDKLTIFCGGKAAQDVLLKTLLQTIRHFETHLRVINMCSDEIEHEINKSCENKNLLNMFTLEKGLVYYVNALNGNRRVIERMKVNAQKFNFTEENIELLDDLAIENRLFINGEYTAAAENETFETVDPVTQAPLAKIARGKSVDIDRAVSAARGVFERGDWSLSSPAKRKAVLNKLADLMEAHAEELALLETLDTGKPIRHSLRDDIPGGVSLDRLPSDASDTIRLVRIGDYDVCPCIGKHVRSTAQIGRFEMLGTNWDELSHTFRIRYKVVQ